MSDPVDDSPFHPPGSDQPLTDRPPAYGTPVDGLGGPGQAGAPPGYGQPGYGQPPGYGDGYSYGVGSGGYGSGCGYPPTGYGYPTYVTPRAEAMAIVSMVLSIVAWLACFIYGIGVVAAIAGVILGFLARKKIRESDGMLTGDGMALAGIIVGAVNIVVVVGFVVAFLAILATSS